LLIPAFSFQKKANSFGDLPNHTASDGIRMQSGHARSEAPK
jgi:hypothetical protein